MTYCAGRLHPRFPINLHREGFTGSVSGKNTGQLNFVKMYITAILSGTRKPGVRLTGSDKFISEYFVSVGQFSFKQTKHCWFLTWWSKQTKFCKDANKKDDKHATMATLSVDSSAERWPDGHGGTLRQASSSALQPGVDLTHLHGAFQPHHLQELVGQVWNTQKHL